MSQNLQSDLDSVGAAVKRNIAGGCLTRLYKNASMILVILVVGIIFFSLARQAVYKIWPNERGLHLRGGYFLGVDQPGWHFRIPYVDTVIGVNIVERPGIVDKISAMTADDVTMDIDLLYTFRVSDPARYALEVTNPDAIVSSFVQGTVRDIVNAREMNDVLHGRAEINQELLVALQQKESQYGVEFVLVQIQNASPPTEVMTAIKDKMVAVQLEEQASAEAAQQRILADSQFYAAQKKAQGEAYQITRLAEAEAQQIEMSSKAQVEAMREILAELEAMGPLGQQYLQVLIAQELRENSKLIITSGGGTLPIIDLGDTNPPATGPLFAP